VFGLKASLSSGPFRASLAAPKQTQSVHQNKRSALHQNKRSSLELELELHRWGLVWVVQELIFFGCVLKYGVVNLLCSAQRFPALCGNSLGLRTPSNSLGAWDPVYVSTCQPQMFREPHVDKSTAAATSTEVDWTDELRDFLESVSARDFVGR
jgi:hypothetical protein